MKSKDIWRICRQSPCFQIVFHIYRVVQKYWKSLFSLPISDFLHKKHIPCIIWGVWNRYLQSNRLNHKCPSEKMAFTFSHKKISHNLTVFSRHQTQLFRRGEELWMGDSNPCFDAISLFDWLKYNIDCIVCPSPIKDDNSNRQLSAGFCIEYRARRIKNRERINFIPLKKWVNCWKRSVVVTSDAHKRLRECRFRFWIAEIGKI